MAASFRGALIALVSRLSPSQFTTETALSAELRGPDGIGADVGF